MNNRLIIWLFEVSIYEGAKWCYTDSGCFHQPCVSIDAGTFIEPSLLQCCVCPHTNKVVTSIIDIFCYVIHLSCIATGLSTHIEAIEPDACITEHTIELERDMLSKVAFWNVDCLTIPSHTCLRILITYRFVAMGMACFGSIRQRGYKVVRHSYLLPCRVIELYTIRSFVVNGVCFCEIIKILGSTPEVELGVSGISKVEPPTFVKTYAFPYTLCTTVKKWQTDYYQSDNLFDVHRYKR